MKDFLRKLDLYYCSTTADRAWRPLVPIDEYFSIAVGNRVNAGIVYATKMEIKRITHIAYDCNYPSGVSRWLR